MILLPNNCKCSKLNVYPSNWNTVRATTKKDWYITYRFYDPTVTNESGKIKPKLVMIKGMNVTKDIDERKIITRNLIDNELDLLKNKGFNPITKTLMYDNEENFELDPSTPFINALKWAVERIVVVDQVRKDIKCIIERLNKSAVQLRIDRISINSISRKHIKALLEQCGKNSTKFSNHTYNSYRGYLMMLFNELVESEACNANVVRDISKRKTVKKIRIVLAYPERKKIDDHLKNVFPEFREFIHVFFHSGGRSTELFQLKPPMVDLENQKYRCIVKKRKVYTEVWRTIKTIAIPHWEFFLKNCPDDHFIFGTKFCPGLKPIGQGMPTRYWKLYVKDEFKIEADLYALKHLNTTEIVDNYNEETAAALNAHTGTGMVKRIYDVKRNDRVHEQLKSANNKFA